MSIRRLVICFSLAFVVVLLIGIPFRSQLSSQGNPQTPTVLAGRNVNMVSGTTLPGGDPWLQRQNEPSIAVSSRNPLHLLAGCNDYRTVDMPISEGDLPGKGPVNMVGDAWLGVFTSYDGGESWTSTMLPGYPQDPNGNPLKLYRTAADPVVRCGPNGIFYYSGIAFNRTNNVGVVFVARFIDNNNKEGGDSIQYIDTKIIAVGNANKFLDKPWIAVDQPRAPISNVTVSGQSIPRHNVYITYSAFATSGSTTGDIMFARSTDCGTTWGAPIKISSGSYAHQGATIAIKPVLGEVLVAWRRFAQTNRTPDSIYVAQSLSRGLNFQSPVKVADIAPFDQPTTDPTQSLPGAWGPGPAFRTNSYPTMAVDASGHVYLAWSQRGVGPNGDARIMVSSSYLGSSWSTPQSVATSNENTSILGHQIMPSFSFAAGKLILVWYDERNDISPNQLGFNKWIQDGIIQDTVTLRHTLDVWAAVAETKNFPTLTWKSTQVSRYLYAALKKADGSLAYDSNGYPRFFPVQFNCVNYPLFKGGLNPFMGDYIDVAASPTFRIDTWRNWYFNATSTDSPVFQVAWADNRDVRPPLDGDWTKYVPPVSPQDQDQAFKNLFITPSTIEQPRPTCGQVVSGNEPGMRNQNIYTSRVTWGIEAGSPTNTKPLNLSDAARAFVVFVKNNTGSLRHFLLKIANQPVGGQASFLQFELLTSLNVDIAPYSTVSRPVFVSSTDPTAPVTINISETDATGSVLTGGLTSSVLLNGDPTSPQLTGGDESHDPTIVNSANPTIVDWYVSPGVVTPNLVNPNLVNPNLVNPNLVNPNLVNYDISNPNLVNPNLVNPNLVNPNLVNYDISNPNLVNPNLVNPNLVNLNLADVDPADVSITDVQWTVENTGSATTSYTLKTLSKKAPPDGVYVQLLVYRVHYTPAVAGAELSSADSRFSPCTLQQEAHHELVLNLVNPNLVNPNLVNPNLVNPNLVNSSIENATFSVAPGEEVIVDLRVLDSGLPQTGGTATVKAMAAPSEAPPQMAANTKEFIDSIGFAVTSQAVNTEDARPGGSQTPPAAATTLVIGTASLPDGVVNAPYNAVLLAYGGSGPYIWTFESGVLPPGLSFSSGGLIGGTPTTPGTYNFIVRVDSGGQFDTQRYSIYVYSGNQPGSLAILTNSLPSGILGHYYGATLEAIGGVWPRTWRLASGSLPLGLILDSGGVISGTIQQETGQDYPTTYNFSVVVTDKNGVSSAPKPLSIYVNLWTKTYIKISGTVYSTGGTPLNGVVMRGLPNTPVSGTNGTPGYYEDTVPSLWSGTVIPFKAGETFSPSSKTYTQVASDQNYQDYNFQYFSPTISGSVTFYGAGLAGVVLNGLPGSPSTDNYGSYAVTVTYGWSGTVTPTKDGYTFTPSSQPYTSVVSNLTTNYTAATLIGPASKLVFTQSPSGGVGGTIWTMQPKVEIQDSDGRKITTDNSTLITLAIKNNPGVGSLGGGATSITVINGEADFADLSINKGGWGYTLEATASLVGVSAATSETFNIEGFRDTAGTLNADRQGHTATPIFMGEEDMVLIAGGVTSEGITSGVDFYDPTTNSFTSPDLTMNHSRSGHTATALLDGTVLIVGGDPDPSTAEIFDPATPRFTDTSVMAYPRSNHRATLLQNGTVLITGSDETDKLEAEIYDPKTGAFTKTGPMHAARCSHTSTLLPNGEVLITGGQDNANDGLALSSAELYDPDTGEFTVIGETMAGGARFNHQATLLDNGTVLITGGNNGVSQLTSAEIYSPPDSDYSTGHFSLIDNVMSYAHEGHQAVLLRDGTVLLIGGNISSAANEIFDPVSSTSRATGPMSRDRSYGATAVLTDGRVLITGGYTNVAEGGTNTAEVWNALVPFPTHIISGTIRFNAIGVGGVMLDGLPGHPITNNGGYYEGLVMNGWSGTVTPTKPGYTFDPPYRNYSDVVGDISGEDYSVTSAAAFRLAFSQQPSNTVIGTNITPAVAIEIQDEFGNILGNASNPVTLSLSTNPGGATLSGTLTVNAVEGVATFSDLKIDKLGSGYILRATSGSLTASDSNPFNVSGAEPSAIQVETAPDGSGAIVPAQNVSSGSSVTVYAISRGAGGNFIANVAADSWSLANKTGGVVDGDLVPSDDMKSAVFSAHLIGTAQIRVWKSGTADSGVLSVVPAVPGFWQQTNGPLGGIVHSVVVDADGRIFAGCPYSGLFRSADGGNTWTQVSTNAVESLAVNSSGHIFLGTRGVRRSTDSGSTWTEINNGLPDQAIMSLAASPNGHIFAGTYNGAIYRSVDNGDSWTQVGVNLSSGTIYCLAINPSGHVFAGTVEGGIFRSTNDGDAWTQVRSGSAYDYVYAIAINANGDVFSGSGNYGVYRSTDNCQTWTAVNNGITNSYVSSLAIDSSGNVFAGTGGGVFRSTNNGDNWTIVTNGLANTFISALTVVPNDNLYSGTEGGIYRSTNHGDSWNELPLIATYIDAISQSPNGRVFAGVYGDGVSRTPDKGTTWIRVNAALTRPAMLTEAVATNAAGYILEGSQAGIFRSTDEGATWNQATISLSSGQWPWIYSFAVNPSGVLFAGGLVFSGGTWVAAIFRSSDNGANWGQLTTGLSGYIIRSISIGPNGHLFAGGNDSLQKGIVYKSADNGDSWAQVLSSNPGIVMSLAINADGYVFAGTYGGGVLRSMDDGASWSQAIRAGDYLAIDSRGYVFAATGNGDLFCSMDKGTTWVQLTSNPWTVRILSLLRSSDDYIFAGTLGKGVYRSGQPSTVLNIGAGAPSKIQVETAADGSGTLVPAQNLPAGTSTTVFLISRDAGGNFVANVPAWTWSLVNKTGGVVDGDLVPSSDMKSATFTGHAVGTAQIRATRGSLAPCDTDVLSVGPGALDHFDFSAIPSPQTVNASFSVAITAKDAFGNAVTNYAGPNTLEADAGTVNRYSVPISPSTTGTFLNGVWSGTVSIGSACQAAQVHTTGGGRTGQSNTFDVVSSWLTFTVQPTDAAVGQTITAMLLAADPSDGSPIPGAVVTLTMGNNPGGVSLSLSVVATDTGYARFQFSISVPGNGYTVIASYNVPGFGTVTRESNPFNVY
jgi:photosystem II stability/assembly factor-like uncharacterized protein/uncharacterized protein YjbI with pentapeptide repeats